MNNRKSFLYAIGIFFLISLVLTFLSRTIYNYNLPTVSVSLPTQGELINTVTGSAEVECINSYFVYSHITGRVSDISVVGGQNVKKDQELMLIETEEGSIPILAKTDGVITAIGGINEGMFVSNTQNVILFEIGEVSNEWNVYLKISQEEREQIALNNKAHLKIDGVSEEVIGNVKEISTYKNANEEGYLVLINFIVEEGNPLGKKADIEVKNESITYDSIIPNYALRKDAKGYFVLVMKEQKNVLGTDYIAQRVSVDLLETDSSFCAVVGLTPDMLVIESETRTIGDGDRVKYEESGEN